MKSKSVNILGKVKFMSIQTMSIQNHVNSYLIIRIKIKN